jgi:putative transposase
VSVARFFADQRAFYQVPNTFTCLLGVSVSWFYKWRDPKPNARQQRRTRLDAAVKAAFGAARGLPGSPRLQADLVEAGWKVSEKTVEDSMRRLGLVARIRKRTRGMTKQDKTAAKFPDVVKRDFTATAPNSKWCSAITEIPTAREAVSGYRDQPVLASAACRGELAASRRRVGLRGDPDGRDRPRWPPGHRGGRLPHRPRLDLHGQGLHPAVRRQNSGSAIHGPGGAVFRQRRRRGVLLLPRVGSPIPAPARRHRPGPRRSPDWWFDFYNHTRRRSSANMIWPINYGRASVQPDAA